MASVITSVLPIVSTFLVAFFVPESPVWLVNKGREEKARRSMEKIYGKKASGEIEQDMQFLLLSYEKNKQKSLERLDGVAGGRFAKNVSYLTKPTFYKPFLIVMTYFFFQQFTGTFVVIFYAINIVEEAGVKIDAYLAIVLIALTRLIGSFIVSFGSKYYGRRPPSIFSGAGMTICMILLSGYLFLSDRKVISADTVDSINWLPMFLLIVYFFTATIGFLTLPFAIAPEVYPVKVRGVATGLTVCLAYLFNFVVVKLYPAMNSQMRNYGIFFFYGAMSLVGTLFIIFFLPETKGKTLQEIEEYFGSKKSKDVETKPINS